MRSDADYVPRTLSQLVSSGTPLEMPAPTVVEPSMQLYGDVLPSQVKVSQQAQSRPIPEDKKAVIEAWARRFAGSMDSYVGRFDTEMAFIENGAPYWLAVRNDLAPGLAEVKRGETVELHVVQLGAVRSGEKTEALILVDRASPAQRGSA